MRNLHAIGVLLGCAALSLHSQPAPSFEVASVKVSPPRQGTARYTTMDNDPGLFRCSNITLKNLIAIAYRTSDRLIVGGPSWLDETAYDVDAKLPPETPKDQVPDMLQTLLAERFKLAVQRESKQQRSYSLVVGKNGPKLKASQDSGQNNLLRGRIVGPALTMGVLADLLARSVGYQVVDKTGIEGAFAVDLKWTLDDAKTPGPNLFAAIQEQLGLKLEPGKSTVETLVIDRAERVPTDN
jgi:uncharacterized protein (TIGR03435 family)